MIDIALATVEASGIKDNFYKSHKSAFFHVLLAMKGRFYFEKGDCVKAKEVRFFLLTYLSYKKRNYLGVFLNELCKYKVEQKVAGTNILMTDSTWLCRNLNYFFFFCLSKSIP